MTTRYTPQQPSLNSTGWGRVIPVGRAIASPQADATWKGVLCLRNMAPLACGMTHTGILVAVPSYLSPQQQPQTLLMAFLVHSALPLMESRVSGCKVFCIDPLRQRSQTFLAPGIGFVEDNFSMDRQGGVVVGFWG